MDVRVDQSGKNQFPAEVDRRCLPRFDQQLDLGIIANGDNAVACEGDRLLERARRVGRKIFPFQSTTSAFPTSAAQTSSSQRQETRPTMTANT
jgi:hypothetical protein